MHDSAAVNSSCDMRPARTSSDICHTPVPEPICLPRKWPGEHRPARNADGRQVATRRAHQQRGRGLVAAHEQHDAVHGIAANRFFDVHAGEIAKQHRGRLELRLAERHHGKLERKSAGLVHAALDEFRELAEVSVARRELAPGIADADDRTAVEHVVRIALVLEPAAVNEAVLVLLTEPVLAAQPLFHLRIHRLASSDRHAPSHKRQWNIYTSAPFRTTAPTRLMMVVDRRDSSAALTGGASYPSLRGRSVFITGGGSGIGGCLTESFARQGSLVAFVDVADGPSQALVEKVEDGRAAAPVVSQVRRDRYSGAAGRHSRCRARPSATSTYSSITWRTTTGTISWTSRPSTTTRASR